MVCGVGFPACADCTSAVVKLAILNLKQKQPQAFKHQHVSVLIYMEICGATYICYCQN